METEKRMCENCEDKCKCKYNSRKREGFLGGVYGLGFIGALVYFIQNAETFWIGVLGFFKAIIWPVFVVYKLLNL